MSRYMFQMRVFSPNLRIVKMISANLPDPDTDPPDKNEVKGLTPDDLIREVFGLYKDEIKQAIIARNGEWTIGQLGIWLRQRNGYEERWATASLGKKGLTVVLKALGFRVSAGIGPGAKVTNPPG